jgi:hypothetical protein
MTRLIGILIVLLMGSTPVFAQADDDRVLKPAEPDVTLMSLPTSLRLPQGGAAFRITHRFVRSLTEGDFGDVAADLFGMDNGAAIGLEFRYGLLPNAYVGVRRVSGRKIIDFFGEYGLTRQSESMPVEMAAYLGIEGTNNFGLSGDENDYSGSIGIVISRVFGEAGALHIQPVWVGNANIDGVSDDDGDVDDNSMILGFGGRARLASGTYFLLEAAPRIAGASPGISHWSFGVEKRVGGHLFQVNFSNTLGTTMGQLARGGGKIIDISEDGREETPWHLGFSITRKFF